VRRRRRPMLQGGRGKLSTVVRARRPEATARQDPARRARAREISPRNLGSSNSPPTPPIREICPRNLGNLLQHIAQQSPNLPLPGLPQSPTPLA
jgi:hypothetical protein